MFKRLRGARLDGSYEDQMRTLHRVDLLILDLSRLWGYSDRAVWPRWGAWSGVEFRGWAGGAVGIIDAVRG
jgi:hypothetical protein